MISETQKALIDMLRTKGTSQTSEQLIQTLQTLHWHDDDIRDATDYFVQKSDGVAPTRSTTGFTPTSSFQPRANDTLVATRFTPPSTAYNTMQTNMTTPTTLSSDAPVFVGGSIDASVPMQKKSSGLWYGIALMVLVALGIAGYIFRNDISMYVNELIEKNTNQQVVVTETEVENEPPVILPPVIVATTSAPTTIVTEFMPEKEDVVINTNLQKQLQNVMVIRKAIATHTMLYNTYPATLADLTQPIASGTIQVGIVYPSIVRVGKPILTSVPRQVGVSSAYGYKKGNEDYDLTYSVTLPEYNVENNIYSYIGAQRFDLATKKLLKVSRTNATFHEANYGLFKNDTDTLPTRLIQMMVQDGTNTATKIALSKEVWAKVEIDTDGDTLTDSLENYIGTNVQSSDSDLDGITDRDEVRLKTNPIEKN